MLLYCDLVQEHVRSLPAYAAGKPLRQAELESGVTCIKLASNENPYGPSPRAIEAMRAAIAEVNFYPDNDATELRSRLAARYSVKPENVLVTAGSTSLLGIAARVLLGPGLNAVTSQRSFIAYSIAAKAARGEAVEVPTRGDGYDLDGLAEAINLKTRLVFLANPNNPTGTLLTADEIERFLDRVPPQVTVILDEAYYEYAEHRASREGVDYSRSLQFLAEARNVMVLRTFSKAQGLAGVRVGYGIGPPELMGYCARLKTMFSVSVVAQAAAMAALEDEAHLQMSVENNLAQAKYLQGKLADMGVKAAPTWANFIYCDVGRDAAEIASRLQAEGVIIRPLGPWGAATAIRVTVGTPEQNEKFVQAFAKVIA
jgi:histidinol-phosphate aminotransferase